MSCRELLSSGESSHGARTLDGRKVIGMAAQLLSLGAFTESLGAYEC